MSNQDESSLAKDGAGTGSKRNQTTRKPIAQGLARSIEVLEQLAQALQRNELRGVQLEGTGSAHVLKDLYELLSQVYGEDSSEALGVLYRLACAEAALGHHEKAVEVLQALLEKQRKRLGNRNVEVVKLLRALAVSYEKLDRSEDCEEARREAKDLALQMLGKQHKPDLVSALTDLITDEVRTAGGVTAAPVELFANDCAPGARGKKDAAPIPRRGEIWWVEFPQYPNDPHNPRPAVIVSVDHRNERADKVQVVPLSSKNNGHRMNFAIAKDDSGLQYDSCAKCGDITAVAKTLLRGDAPLGRVPKETVDGIVNLAQQALRP